LHVSRELGFLLDSRAHVDVDLAASSYRIVESCQRRLPGAMNSSGNGSEFGVVSGWHPASFLLTTGRPVSSPSPTYARRRNVMKTRRILVSTLGLAVVVGAAVRAEEHKFVPTAFHTTFSAVHPVALKLKSGDRVVTSTLDDTGTGADGKPVVEGSLPQTGPFFIEGAEPGDLLVVSIDALTPNRTTGYSTSLILPASIDPKSITSRPDPTRFAWTIDTAKQTVTLDLGVFRGVDWKSRFGTPYYQLPLTPMLGSIGVAPAGTEEPAATGAGAFGGNILSAAVVAGSKVMLEVKQPGALLFFGHGLAAKGEGMITGTGIETSMDVAFSVEVVKKKEWPHSSDVRPSTVVGEFTQGWPRIESATYLTTVGTGPTLLDALQHATIELHHWLDDDFGLNEKGVNVLVGQAIEYEIAKVGEDSFTVAAKMKKSYLPQPLAK
jgi:acetamidase/formamidase